MSDTTPELNRTTCAVFTAAQIGRALTLTPQRVRQLLFNVAPARQIAVAGNMTAAWAFLDLPLSVREKLQRAAEEGNYRNAEHYLSKVDEPWEPAVPVDQLSAIAIDKASKLRTSFVNVFLRMADPEMSQGELTALGLAEFKSVFGYSISERQWKRRFDEILKRDRGAAQYHRLALYVDYKIARKPKTREKRNAPNFPDLAEFIESFASATNPTASEKQLLWIKVCELLTEREGERALRARLVDFLNAHAPFLAASKAAIDKQLSRKFKEWIDNGGASCALADHRISNSGNFRAPTLTQEDEDRICWQAMKYHGGNLAPAWRTLLGKRELSSAVLEYYAERDFPANSSYVPPSVRSALAPLIRAMMPHHHGKRTAELAGGWIQRDWSGVHSGDWYQADDCTLPVYFAVQDDKDGWQMMRGQLLLMVDVRSNCILGYTLLPSPNYNAFAIRSLMTQVCSEHGLPRKGFWYECGIWKRAQVIKGKSSALAWSEVETGLKQFGVTFRHSTTPRAKIVERVLGAVQNLMFGEPGYIGRNERVEKFEEVQRQLTWCRSGKVDPRKYFYTFEEWESRLGELFQQYNDTRHQPGGNLDGKSPNEAFEAFAATSDPLIRFGPETRYLLASEVTEVTVSEHGISLHRGKYIYRGREISPLIGKRMLAWFDPLHPDVITLTDLSKSNPVFVPRAHAVSAIDGGEAFVEERRRLSAHGSYPQERYRTLKTKFKQPFRRNVVDGMTRALGEKIEERRSQIEETQRAVRSDRARASKVYSELGMAVPARANVTAAMELQSALADLAMEANSGTSGGAQ